MSIFNTPTHPLRQAQCDSPCVVSQSLSKTAGGLKQISFFVFFILLNITSFSQFPNTDIWLLDIKQEKDSLIFTNPVNITNRDGYDNQPAFSPDGKYILYSSLHDTTQADIYKYDIATKQTTQFTKTPESEFSPTFMPGGKFISTVRVEKDSIQRLWKFPVNGGEPTLVMDKIDSIGYHCWLNKDTVALFILTKPFTLQLVDIHKQTTKIISENIGRCMQKTKDNNDIFFVIKPDTISNWKLTNVRNYLPLMGEINRKMYQEILKGCEDFVFVNNHQIITRLNSELIRIDLLSGKSKTIANLSQFGINNLGRLAISPDGKILAVVNTK